MSSNVNMVPLITDLIKKNKYSHILLQVALEERNKITDSFCFARIDFAVYKEKPCDVTYDYGNFKMIRKLLDISQAPQILSEIQSGSLTIDGKSVNLKRTGANEYYRFVPSGMQWSYIDATEPTYLIFTNSSGSDRISYDEIIDRPKLPHYPTRRQAIVDFMGVHQMHDFNSECIIVLHDYRGIIDELGITGKEVRMTIGGNSEESDLIVKLYCRKGENQRESSPDILVKDKIAKYDVGFEPDSVEAVLVSISANETLDRKSTTGEQKGVIIKTPPDYVRELIAGKESRTVEFKTSLQDTNDLLETVVAFSNTVGGTIIVGVDDDGPIVGFWDSPRVSIEKSILGRVAQFCEPSVEVKLEWTELDNKPLLLIKVVEGVDKPYMVRKVGIFIRDNRDDYHVNRQQLDKVYADKFSGNEERRTVF